MESIREKMKATTGFVKDGDDFLTKPMFEVFSITIHSNENTICDGKPCHIHGIVRVLDEDGKTYELYNRKSDNVEIINLGGFISLTNFTIIPFKVLRVSVMLYDVARGIEISHGVFDLNYSKSYDYNKVHITRVDGEHGFASVYHSTFQHAVIACVDRVEFRKNVGSSDTNNPMFGTVIARLKRIRGRHEYPNAILFDNRQYSKQSTNVQTQLNTPLNLFRSLLVVPVDCYLIIEADFCDDIGRKYVTDIHLNASPRGLKKDSVTSQTCEMYVEVDWRHAYDEFPEETKAKDLFCVEEKSQQPSTLSEEPTNFTKLISEAQRPSSSISRRQPCAAIPILSSCVEVFSVLICVDDKEVDIFGTIQIRDSTCCPFYIFDGHERLGDRKTLSIVAPIRSFNDKPFSIHVDLKDGKGRVVSKGSIRWNCNDDDPISWYDRNICSVIRGNVGYAAIHYSLITYGAQVRIELEDLWPCGIGVYGRITAWYKNYGYRSLYDERYYKITLFSKSREECASINLELDPPIPSLSKSCVSVPLMDSLILDVNLKVICPCKDRDDKKMNNNGGENTIVDVHALMEFPPDVSRRFVINEEYKSVTVSTRVGRVMLPEQM